MLTFSVQFIVLCFIIIIIIIFFWFSDPYTFPSERGTEALIKSFFQLTSKIMVRRILYLHRYSVIVRTGIKSVLFPVFLFLKLKPKSQFSRTFKFVGSDYALKSNNEIREKMSG